jgi:hypothetical protein
MPKSKYIHILRYWGIQENFNIGISGAYNSAHNGKEGNVCKFRILMGTGSQTSQPSSEAAHFCMNTWHTTVLLDRKW